MSNSLRDVVVVGAGIVGAAIAHELSRYELFVTLVEPVAGPVGLGSASYCQDTGSCAVIGVDTDQFFAAPDFANVWLTSVVKEVDVFVFDTIENEILFGTPGSEYLGTLANGGTDLAPYHDFEDSVPQALKDEVDQLRLDVIGGVVVPGQ